jgi:hypothetical protein
MSLKDFEDMIVHTRSLKKSGKLGLFIPYPEENPHLIGDLAANILVS